MSQPHDQPGQPNPATPASAAPADLLSLTPDEREAYWYRHQYVGAGVRQLSFRAVAVGSVLGSLMSIAALYTTLKIGWSFGVAITACVLSYVSWNVLRKLSGNRLSQMTMLENNCMQSTASAAGYSTGSTISTAVAATLLITGEHFHWTVLVPFVLLSGLLGVFLAIPMKRQLINIEQLRFPSGIAAAETLRSLYSGGRESLQRAYALVIALALGAIVGVLKAPQGVLHWLDALVGRIRLPDLLHFPTSLLSPSVAGKGREFIGFGFEPGLLLIGAGMLTGLRVSLSMLAGSVLLYFIVGPQLIAMDEAALLASPDYKRHVDLVAGGTIYHVVRWALWGGCSLMVVGGMMSLLFQAPAIIRSFRFAGKESGAGSDSWLSEQRRTVEVPSAWLWLAMPPLTIALIVFQAWAFGTPWLLGAIAVALSFVIALVCARVTGETDTTPIGPMGKVTQLVYAVLPGSAGNQTINLMTAGVTSNAGIAAADLLTDLKSGYVLGANPRQQFLAQLFGVFVGTGASVIGWYLMIPSKEVLETYPAPATQSWRAFAEALTKGLSSVPTSAQAAAVIGAVLGILLPSIEKVFPKARPYLPSAMGLGLAWVIPFSNSLAFTVGALLVWLWGKLDRRSSDTYSVSIASGFIAGESLLAAMLAILATLAGTFPWLAGAAPTP